MRSIRSETLKTDETQIAEMLAQAYLGGSEIPETSLSGLTLPQDLETAERVQDAMLSRLGSPPVAWKLGASTHAARTALGLDRPFAGLLQADRVFSSPAELPASVSAIGIECEYAFCLGRKIGPAEVIDRDVVAGSIVSLHPAIEIPASRLPRIGALGPLMLVADNGAAGYCVIGEGRSAAPYLRGEAQWPAATLIVNGKEIASGGHAALLQSPLPLFQRWAADLVARGHVLEEGAFVLLGALTPYSIISKEDKVRADFSEIGAVFLARL